MAYEIALGNPDYREKGIYRYSITRLSEHHSEVMMQKVTLGEALFHMADDGWSYRGSHHDMLIWERVKGDKHE